MFLLIKEMLRNKCVKSIVITKKLDYKPRKLFFNLLMPGGNERSYKRKATAF